MGCDCSNSYQIRGIKCFNPRTRVGCDVHGWYWLRLWLCFNPRTRVGCDRVLIAHINRWHVSIHAPVWGATALYGVIGFNLAFQSTHPCGVRLQTLPLVLRYDCFNPRTRVGCDDNPNQKFKTEYGFNPRTRVGCDPLLGFPPSRHWVSIHAPVWGATKGQILMN